MRRAFSGTARAALVACAAVAAAVLAAGVAAVSTEDTITTIAGSGRDGVPEDGGQATSSSLRSPSGVAVDGTGNVYLVDSLTGVWKVTPDGLISGFAGTKQARTKQAGALGDDDLGDGGLAIEAMLTLASDVAVDGAGNVYIADSGNDRVRKVTGGIIATVAGTGAAGLSGDGGPAGLAQLNTPQMLALDRSGDLYISDQLNHRIRKLTPAGILTTVAGTSKGFAGDGGPASLAQLADPHGLALDRAGNLYIADTGNRRVRKVAAPAVPAAPGEGMPPGASPAADTAVEGDVIGAVATRSRRGLRLVRVELQAEERLSARLVLVRRGRTLASRGFATVEPGSRVLSLVVPRRVRQGRATVRVELSDAVGNTRVLRRGVSVPAVGRAA